MTFNNILPECYDAALITSNQNRRYLSGTFWDDGYMIVTRDNIYVCADSRCFEAVEKSSIELYFSPILVDNYANFLMNFLKEKSLFNIVCEGSIAVNKLNRLNKNDSGIIFDVSDDFDNKLSLLRRSKSQNEFKKIKTAQQIAEAALDRVISRFKIGMTEIEFAANLEFEMRKLGSNGPAFETIAISGKNTSMPHSIPTDNPIEKGGFLTVDFGAVYDGYRSDMTRTFAVGDIAPEMKEIYNVVLTAQKACIEKIYTGMSCFDADKICRDIISDAGYGEYFTHSTGHGVGLDIHENPNLSPSSKDLLKIGDIVTVEPGIYFKNRFGVRIEDMLYFSESGVINLTEYAKELTEI